jgi:hypothetical protein
MVKKMFQMLSTVSPCQPGNPGEEFPAPARGGEFPRVLGTSAFLNLGLPILSEKGILSLV